MSEKQDGEGEKEREKYWRPRASARAAIRPPINYIDVKKMLKDPQIMMK